MSSVQAQEVPCIIVGAGPAGLATAACLKEAGVEPLVLERSDAVGSSWRRHYTRLHLHTVKKHSGLPFRGFDAHVPRYPSRDEVVAYFEDYAAHFEIRPRHGVTVESLERGKRGWAVHTDGGTFRSPHVVMATGYNRVPNRPDWPGQEEFPGTVLHSSEFKSGSDFTGQRVLVVGCGNSGAEIALDLHEAGATTALVVRSPLWVTPRDVWGLFPSQISSIRLSALPVSVADFLAKGLLRLLVGDLSRYGIDRPEEGPNHMIWTRGRVPMLDIGTLKSIKAGEIAVHRGVERFEGPRVHFTDAASEEFDAVVLATGYRSGLSALLPDGDERLNARGLPTRFGADGGEDGLFFIGFRNPPTGALREIAIEAQGIAACVAGSPALLSL
jgi:indole-3-pyruvate monooxygenase